VPIAPRTFHAWVVRAPSKRALWEATITEVLAGYYQPDEHGRRKPESLYGSLKMWAHLQHEGIPVAKSTVERLMRRHGWQGVRRQKTVRTTIANPSAARPPDLVDRQFGVGAPNRLLVADFTYVKLFAGVFVYVAFVIDAYAGAIVGWEASASKQTRFVESAIRQAAALRFRQGHPIDGAIHHSDARSQYTSVRFGETLSLSGLQPSVGSVGDAYDCRRRDDQRAVQERMHPCGLPVSPRATTHPRRRRIHHRRLRHLIQPAAPHAPPRPCPTRPGRSPVLFRTRDRPTGQLTEPQGCMKLGMVQPSDQAGADQELISIRRKPITTPCQPTPR
jgi:putative transposase